MSRTFGEQKHDAQLIAALQGIEEHLGDLVKLLSNLIPEPPPQNEVCAACFQPRSCHDQDDHNFIPSGVNYNEAPHARTSSNSGTSEAPF